MKRSDFVSNSSSSSFIVDSKTNSKYIDKYGCPEVEGYSIGGIEGFIDRRIHHILPVSNNIIKDEYENEYKKPKPYELKVAFNIVSDEKYAKNFLNQRNRTSDIPFGILPFILKKIEIRSRIHKHICQYGYDGGKEWDELWKEEQKNTDEMCIQLGKVVIRELGSDISFIEYSGSDSEYVDDETEEEYVRSVYETMCSLNPLFIDWSNDH